MRTLIMGFMFAASVSVVATAAVKMSKYGIEVQALTLDQWASQQTTISIAKVLQNITLSDGMPGSMATSPERYSPPYYFHWIRDSGITYSTVLRLAKETSGSEREMYIQHLLEFADFSKHIQGTTSDLGEPKFYVTGEPYTGPWCRPQSDGPALRAIAMMDFYSYLSSQSTDAAVLTALKPTIQKDIQYVLDHWRESTCDLWEEVYGNHFYTRMVQRKALRLAAGMSGTLDLNQNHLQHEAEQLSSELESHWDSSVGYIVSTLHRTGGLDYKYANLDASIILAVLHGHTDDGFMSYTDPRVMATAQALDNAFKDLYPVNRMGIGMMGVAIGRYPEDQYRGELSHNNGGNPWVLLTAAMAQYYYRASIEHRQNGDSGQADLDLSRAEDYLRRVQYHSPSDGALAEQIERTTGFMTSARDLTWSHTEVLDAFAARGEALRSW